MPCKMCLNFSKRGGRGEVFHECSIVAIAKPLVTPIMRLLIGALAINPLGSNSEEKKREIFFFPLNFEPIGR